VAAGRLPGVFGHGRPAESGSYTDGISRAVVADWPDGLCAVSRMCRPTV